MNITVVAQKNDLEKKLEEISWKFSAEVKLHQRDQETIRHQESAIKELSEKLEVTATVESSSYLDEFKFTVSDNKELQKKLESLTSKMSAETAVTAQLSNELAHLKEQLRLEQENSRKTSKQLDNANAEIEELKKKMQAQSEDSEASTKQREALAKVSQRRFVIWSGKRGT